MPCNPPFRDRPCRLAALLLIASLVAACAGPAAMQGGAAQAAPEAVQTSASDALPAEPSAEAATSTRQLPDVELTRDILFKLLVAEVAGQRGEMRLAAEAYADLTRSTRDPRIARRATEAAVFAQNGDLALEASRIWMEADPGDEQAPQTHVSMLISSGDLEAAEPIIARVLARSGTNPGQALLQLGAMLARNNERQAVWQLAERVSTPYQQLPETHMMLAQLALNAGEIPVALSHARRAVELRPDWEPAILLSAQLLSSSDGPAALQLLGDARKRLPKARGVGLAYARALIGEGQYPKALAEFKRLAAQFPDDGELNVTVGALANDAGDQTTALTYLQRALDTNYAEQDGVRLLIGQIEAMRGNDVEALRWFDSVQPGPSFMPARIGAGRIVLKRDGIDAARALIRSVRASTPLEEVQMILAESQLLRDAGDEQAVFDLLDQATRDYAGIADIWYDHAMAAERLDRIDIVETSLRRVLELQPDHAHAYNALGYSLADRGVRLLEAKGYIEQALELAPNDAYIIDSLGWVQYRLGELEEAEKTLRRALAQRPDPEIIAHLGEVLARRGNTDEARELLQGGLKRHPDNATLLATWARLFP